MAEPWEKALADEGPPAQVMTTERADAIEASSVDVFTKDGKAYLMDPTGREAVVPEAVAPDLLAKGYVPQDEKYILDETYRAHGPGSVGTFVAHGINELMLGAPGLGQRDMSQILRRSEEEHPFAAGAGQVAGLVGGMALPVGPLGMAAKGAKVAGAAAGRGVGRLGTKAAYKLAGGAGVLEGAGTAAGRTAARAVSRATPYAEKAAAWGTQGALEGAAVGAASALSREGVHPEHTVNDALASVFGGMKWGAAGGALLGTASAGLGARAASKVAAETAKRTAASRRFLDDATKEVVATRDAVRADLHKYWTPTQTVGRSARGWAPPSKLDDAQALIAKADDIEKMPMLSFADEASRPSWIRRALDALGKKAAKVEPGPEAAGPMSPMLDDIHRVAKSPVQGQQAALVSDLKRQAGALTKEVDALKTSSGIPVSKLEETARELQHKLAEARGKAIEQFNATYAPEKGRLAALGGWMARSAVARTVGGGVVGGPYGAVAGALMGSAPVEIAARIAASVGRKTGAGARWIGKRAGVRATARVAALRAASKPDEGIREAVLNASPQQIEQAARVSAEQAGLLAGLPQSFQEETVQRNVAAYQFLKAKAEELK